MATTRTQFLISYTKCDSALITSYLYAYFLQRPHVPPLHLVQMPLTTHVLNDAYRVLGARAHCAVAA